jgi:hypothetical protein
MSPSPHSAEPVATTIPSDLLRIADLTAAQLDALLDLADAMKERATSWTAPRDGRAIACLFDNPSTRTRVSFAVAAHRLGMLPIILRPDELELGRGEPPAETARVLSSYTAAIVVRSFAHAFLEELADAASAPVVRQRPHRQAPPVPGAGRSADAAAALRRGDGVGRCVRRLHHRHARPSGRCRRRRRRRRSSIVAEQAANRLPTEQATLQLLVAAPLDPANESRTC